MSRRLQEVVAVVGMALVPGLLTRFRTPGLIAARIAFDAGESSSSFEAQVANAYFDRLCETQSGQGVAPFWYRVTTKDREIWGILRNFSSNGERGVRYQKLLQRLSEDLTFGPDIHAEAFVTLLHRSGTAYRIIADCRSTKAAKIAWLMLEPEERVAHALLQIQASLDAGAVKDALEALRDPKLKNVVAAAGSLVSQSFRSGIAHASDDVDRAEMASTYIRLCPDDDVSVRSGLELLLYDPRVANAPWAAALAEDLLDAGIERLTHDMALVASQSWVRLIGVQPECYSATTLFENIARLGELGNESLSDLSRVLIHTIPRERICVDASTLRKRLEVKPNAAYRAALTRLTPTGSDAA